MKLIFLDFDGVLNSRKWFNANLDAIQKQRTHLTRSLEQLDPAAVKLVSDFAVEMNADTVISSTWRRLFSLTEIQSLLIVRGWKARLPFSVTPKHDEGFRGTEIAAWLTKNHVPDSFVIFDDDSDFFPEQPLVKTTFEFGIQEAHIDLARGILK